ncbi:MAG: glycosyltransferase, partial [Rhodospirillales bacterium]|nr:glycosyltransferase [Acetobacter sp.]
MNARGSDILHLLVHAARGGCERACEQVCRYWPGARHRVLVLGEPGEMSAVWEGMNVPVEHLNVMRLPRSARAAALRNTAARLPATRGAVAWHGMAELPVILHALPADRGPVLVHGGNPANSLRAWTDWRYLLAEWLLFPRRHDPIYTPCSQYVSDSFESSRYLRRFRRHVITNGVDPLPAEAVHVPRPLVPAEDAVTVGMLARLDAIKDHAGLLRAFALLRRRVPHARLELAGDGDQRPALEQLAADLGVAGAVGFLGTVRDVYSLLPRWDLFAYATTENEGFGIALAEALMCGLPAVVTDVGPVREVCGQPGEAAVQYVPP